MSTSGDFDEILSLLETVFAVPVEPSTLLTDLTWDSLARVVLVGEVQERYGLEIEAEQMDTWVSTGDIVSFLLDRTFD